MEKLKKTRHRCRIFDLNTNLTDLAKRLNLSVGYTRGCINIEYHKPHYVLVKYNDNCLPTYPFGSTKRQKKEMYEAIELAIYCIDVYKNLPR